MKKILIVFILLTALRSIAFSQSTDSNNARIEMADVLREDGKIYVVVAILIVILTGIFAFLIVTDRKISRVEKELFLKKDKNLK